MESWVYQKFQPIWNGFIFKNIQHLKAIVEHHKLAES